MPLQQIRFTVHAGRRAEQRRIFESDVRHVLDHGEIIRTYPYDTPQPSYLMLGWVCGRPLHVVAADDVSKGETIVISTYEPDPQRWEPDFKRRKP